MDAINICIVAHAYKLLIEDIFRWMLMRSEQTEVQFAQGHFKYTPWLQQEYNIIVQPPGLWDDPGS